jgi:cell division protein FtsB
MFDKIRNFWNSQRVKRLIDPRNIGLYVFGVIVLAIAWSGVRTVQSNYQLQKQISQLEEENAVLQLKNENIRLENKFLETSEYQELTARQLFGLAAPGETVWNIPESTALKYVDKEVKELSNKARQTPVKTPDDRPEYKKNLQDWRDFLIGREAPDN